MLILMKTIKQQQNIFNRQHLSLHTLILHKTKVAFVYADRILKYLAHERRNSPFVKTPSTTVKKEWTNQGRNKIGYGQADE